MTEEDHCVYVKRLEGNFVILSLYVDDRLLGGNNIEFVQTIKEWLFSNFEIKDMGEASYILGVKIRRDRSRKLLALSQSLILEEFLKNLKWINLNLWILLSLKDKLLAFKCVQRL